MTPTDFESRLRAPSLRLLAGELCAPLDALRFAAQWPALNRLPRGDGHAVLILPGFGAGAWSLRPLRTASRRLGYAADDWGYGRNLGMRSHIKQGLTQQLQILFERSGGKVSLIGWSLGGVFARELARAHPQWVRCVMTLGSPINGDPEANNMAPLFRLANRGRSARVDRAGFERRKLAPSVPCIAIYTRSDGIVAWQASCEDAAANTENVEVRGTHLGLAFNHEVLRVIAHRLSTGAG